MNREVGYRWHLRLRMAEQGMFVTTDLGPLLAERGVVLSREQVYRLVTGTPERLSLRTLAALCDILGCTAADLVQPVLDAAKAARRTGTGDQPPSAAAGGTPPLGRPVRARIIPNAPEKR